MNSALAQNFYDYQSVFEDINNMISKYSNDFSKKFNKMELALITELQHRFKLLKEQIIQLRRLTSNEELQAQISHSKQEKQAHRIRLEMEWREITDKLKKMEKQEKQVNDWNRQAEFDVTNLHEKIRGMKEANMTLLERVIELREKRNSGFFMTDNSALSPHRTRARKEKTFYPISQSNHERSDQGKSQMSKELRQILENEEIKRKIFNVLNK